MVLHNYAEEKERVKSFVCQFKVDKKSPPKYTDHLTKVANREVESLFIELDDVLKFDEPLCEAIIGNTKRYVGMFQDCVQELLPSYKTKEATQKNLMDVFVEHRKVAGQLALKARGNVPSQDPFNAYPQELLRSFDLYFTNLTSRKPVPVRDIKSDSIGKLVTFCGIVTRCTEVKPLITVATYVCDRCGSETFQQVSGSLFTPLEACEAQECVTNKYNGRLHLQTRGSKFVRYQEMKIQELSCHVPTGHVPRYLTVAVYGDLTRIVVPGNNVFVTGIFLPVTKKGFKQVISGLLAETYVESHSIAVMNKSDMDRYSTHDLDTKTIKAILKEEDLYEKLASSIAPEIYGHADIKKALLLLLVGGVDQSTSGFKIRGNINMLLVGDPGVAKSQLLSYVGRLSPRSQLTTGRGSSGVGLTAAVLRDSVTDELVLEGGALVLADQGVCCIDEFDKMNEHDRTAIHEVMEQQTVSIAKAGISTILNARVSVLAAANPAYGKYNPKKSLEQNIQLPASLLSRFDLVWPIRDLPNHQNDLKLAQHVTYVHRHNSHPKTNYNLFPTDTLRSYIMTCKKTNSTIPENLKEFLVASYVHMRKESRSQSDCVFTSPRTLLSVLRLSTALARLRMSTKVAKEDVQEAMRLVDSSRSSLVSNEIGTRVSRPQDVIFSIIRELMQQNETKTVQYDEIVHRCLPRGLTAEQLNKCISDYQDLNVLHINKDRSQVTLV